MRSSPGSEGTMFRSLHDRNYRLWFAGSGITLTGQWAQLVAQTILVLEISDSHTLLGLVTALQFLPIVVVGPWAGLLADRYDKRTVIVITQLTMLSTALVIGALELAGRASVPALVVASAVTGVAFGLEQPPRRTFMTDLVDVADAPNAVSLDAAVNNVSKILGPAVAALLVSTVGLGWCFIVNGATCLAALVSMAMMDRSLPHSAPRLTPGRGQIRSAFRSAWSSEAVRVPLLILAPVAVLGFNWNVLIPLLATDELGASSTTFAVMMSVMSIGSVSGTLWLARRGPVTIHAIAVSCICFGTANAALALSPTILVATAAAAAVGATAMVLFNASVIGMQVSAEPGMRGRIMGIFSMVFIGSYGVGGPIAGAVADHVGTRAAIGLGSITALLVGSGALLSRALDARPRAQPVAATTGQRPADVVGLTAE